LSFLPSIILVFCGSWNPSNQSADSLVPTRSFRTHRVLATFTLPPDHHRIAIVTPLVSGGSLSGILNWRSRLADVPNHRHGRFRFGRKKSEEEFAEGGTGLGRLDEEEIKGVMKQVLEGLVYLHERGFLHVSETIRTVFPEPRLMTHPSHGRQMEAYAELAQRDLKAGNILVSADGTVLLADLGVGGDLNEALASNARAPTHPPTAENLRFDQPTTTTTTMPQDAGLLSPIPDARVHSPSPSPSPSLRAAEIYGRRASFVGTVSHLQASLADDDEDVVLGAWCMIICSLRLAELDGSRSDHGSQVRCEGGHLEPGYNHPW
jgi:serine/threonine protein kinase